VRTCLDVDNVAEVLEVMWGLSSALKHLCMQFMFQHYDAVQETEAYKTLPEPIKIEIMQRFDKESEGTTTTPMVVVVVKIYKVDFSVI